MIPEGRKTFQQYMLGSMRDGRGVERALTMLRATNVDVGTARHDMLREGFEQVPVSMRAYEELLGPPQERSTSDTAEPYERTWMSYSFETWTSVRLVVFGSEDGVAAGVRFERCRGQQALPTNRLEDLEPWRTTRGDLDGFEGRFVTKDDWYPVLDVEVELPRDPRACPVAIRFRAASVGA